MKTLFLTLTGLLFLTFTVIGQNLKRCATTEILAERMSKDPSIALRMQQGEIETQRQITHSLRSSSVQSIIVIPVVVHVVYNTAEENISDAQIQSQLDVLNEDFRLLNADALPSNHAFFDDAADTEIQFCLATLSPNGTATTGITRTHTTKSDFSDFDRSEKHSNSGGADNWDPTKYLNIWVCNLGSSILGYATFPYELSSNASEDGVVINYNALGNIGTVSAPYDLGRTAVHEIGHWLNLIHIWGDDECGDDLVADTKPAFTANIGCPTFPHNINSCESNVNGEMYMNYMDYVNDDCMNMFTTGQVSRMRAVLNSTRSGFLANTTANVTEDFSSGQFGVFPNPNNGNFSVRFGNDAAQHAVITIVNMLGETVATMNKIMSGEMELNLPELSNGTYYVQVNVNGKLSTSKIFIAK